MIVVPRATECFSFLQAHCSSSYESSSGALIHDYKRGRLAPLIPASITRLLLGRKMPLLNQGSVQLKPPQDVLWYLLERILASKAPLDRVPTVSGNLLRSVERGFVCIVRRPHDTRILNNKSACEHVARVARFVRRYMFQGL